MGDSRRSWSSAARTAVAFLLLSGLPACGAPDSGHEAPGNDSDAAPSTESGAPAPPDVAGQAPAPSGGIPSVVLLDPLDESSSSADVPAPPGPVVDQFGLAFVPRVLVVPEGVAVRFTNSEGSLTHNVHLRSLRGDSTVFNGDSAPGEELVVELPGPGGYDVLCDMHPGMTGFLFVSPSRYAVAAEADGTFRFDTVPPSRYRVRLWTADGGFGDDREISVEGPGTRIDLTPAG